MNMKHIFITSLFLIGGLIGFASQANSALCQNGTAIVYGNGMFNAWDDADKSRIRLRDEIMFNLQSSPPTQFTVAELEFHLAYANDSGGFAAGFGTGLEQLLEVFIQGAADASTDLMWQWLAGAVKKGAQSLPIPAALVIDIIVPDAPPPWFRVAMQDIAAGINEAAYVNDIDLDFQLNGDPLVLDPALRFEGYKYLLSKGKRLVIVSHSQGNFYANRAYQKLADPNYGGNASLAASIGNVAVATPSVAVLAGKLGVNEPYMTVPEDLVIAGVRAVSPILDAKGGILFSENLTDLGLIAWANASVGHNFVQWYLTGTYTRDFILNGIATTINVLQYSTQNCDQIIPQPGPGYYRDDWSPFHNYAVFGGSFYYIKHLRDDLKGIAYSVTGVYTYPSTYVAYITITDYVTNQVETLSQDVFIDTWQGVPNDVLLWNGGLLVLYSGAGGGIADQNSISWVKLSISDAGIDVTPRWTVINTEQGQLDFPAYDLTSFEWVGGDYRYVQAPSPGGFWKLLGTTYRTSNYTYKIPAWSQYVRWSNFPAGTFPPSPPPLWHIVNPGGAVFEGLYGTVDIVDGMPQFNQIGSAPFTTAASLNPSLDLFDLNVVGPQPVTDFGVGNSMAYQLTQSVDLVSPYPSTPFWNYQWLPEVNIASFPKASLPSNEIFWRVSMTGPEQAASLSDKMALRYNASESITYKLGAGFQVAADDPSLQQQVPPVTIPTMGPFANPVYLTPEQKAFLEDQTPPLP